MPMSASDDDDGAGGGLLPEDPIQNIANHLLPDEEDKYLGEVKSDIVGIRYYNGKVSNNDMVALVREPDNKFDPNAVKVLNMASQKVGYIKRKHAAALAIIMDKSLARVGGTIPYGADFYYQIPIYILFRGSNEKKEEVLTIINSHGMSLRPTQNIFGNNDSFSKAYTSLIQGLQYTPPGATQDPFRNNGSNLNASTSMSQGLPYMPSGATQDPFRNNGSYLNASTSMSQGLPNFLTPQEMQNEFDKIFETLDEGDKRAETEPADAVSTVLFPYQKQALNWMISKENTDTLPPFWEKLNNDCYWNTLAMFISNTTPKSVHGGILADDMGLGKTLEMISLILSNFVDGKPLAHPLPGKCRSPYGSETMVSTKLQKTTVSSPAHTPVVQDSLHAKTNFHHKFSPCLIEERSVRTPRARAPRLLIPIPGKKHENPEPRPSEFNEDTITAESGNGAKSFMKRSVQDACDDMADDELPDIISPSELNKKLKDVAFLKNRDVVITTYSTLTSDFKKSLTSSFNSSPLHKVKWLRIVLDEGHIIRNPSAQQTKAVYELKARRRWILTGTPIQNSIRDFWSMLNFLQVQPFTDESLWDDIIAKPLCSGEMPAVQKVGALMRSLALRRTKNTKYNGKPLIELPTREVTVKWITLSKKERD